MIELPTGRITFADTRARRGGGLDTTYTPSRDGPARQRVFIIITFVMSLDSTESYGFVVSVFFFIVLRLFIGLGRRTESVPRSHVTYRRTSCQFAAGPKSREQRANLYSRRFAVSTISATYRKRNRKTKQSKLPKSCTTSYDRLKIKFFFFF